MYLERVLRSCPVTIPFELSWKIAGVSVKVKDAFDKVAPKDSLNRSVATDILYPCAKLFIKVEVIKCLGRASLTSAEETSAFRVGLLATAGALIAVEAASFAALKARDKLGTKKE